MGVNGIYGLSGSGLDIESMVKVGMMGKQNEYDRMYKKETKANWQKEAYVNVYNEISTFNNTKLTDYKLQSKMNAMQATTNNTTAFSVSANGSAVPMSHKVEVKELSSNAYLMSTEAITRRDKADKGSVYLRDSMFQSITDNGDDTYTVKDWNGNTSTVNAKDTALSLTLDDGQHSIEPEKTRTVTMTYADIAGDKSFNDLASSINKLGLNLTAAYDTVNDSFSIHNKNGGEENTISIKTNNDATAQLFNNFNLGKSENGTLTPFAAEVPEAVEATSSYSGTQSVTELLDGMNYTVTPNEDKIYFKDQEVTDISSNFSDLGEGVKRYQFSRYDDGGGWDVLVRESADTNGVARYQYAMVGANDDSNVDWDWHPAEINGEKYDVASSEGLSDGVKRYSKADGSGKDMLVKTYTESEILTDDRGNQILDDEGVIQFHDVTKYKMMEVDSGAAEPDWNSVSSTTENPVTLTNTSTRMFTSTSPIRQENIVVPETKVTISGSDKAYNVQDPYDSNTGLTRYRSVDNDEDVLIKRYTEDVIVKDEEGKTVLDENGTAKMETVYKYKMARVGVGDGEPDWDSLEYHDKSPAINDDFVQVNGEYKKAEDPYLSFTLNDGQKDTKINITYADLNNLTIDKVVNIINESGSDVKASFDSLTGKFSLQNYKAGDGHTSGLTIDDEKAAAFFQKLGFDDAAVGKSYSHEGSGYQFNAGDATEVKGSNGKVIVDGREYNNITDNRVTVAGVTYTLLDKTESAAVVTVTQDQSSIVDRVKQFVEDYNTMLKSLQDKYTETKYSDYDVLTKNQEDAMTKEQVEKWNEKAKSGLLNRDKYIGDIISKMREALSTPVDGVSGKYNSAFSIGIRTNTDQGQIELDEEKLKQVLTEEPNAIYEIFGKMGEYNSSTKTSDFSTSGVAQRLGDVFNTGLNSLKSRAGTTNSLDDNSELGNKIKDWQNKMSDFKSKMKAFETLLYKKYDAMEMALQKLAMTMNYVSFNQQ